MVRRRVALGRSTVDRETSSCGGQALPRRRLNRRSVAFSPDKAKPSFGIIDRPRDFHAAGTERAPNLVVFVHSSLKVIASAMTAPDILRSANKRRMHGVGRFRLALKQDRDFPAD